MADPESRSSSTKSSFLIPLQRNPGLGLLSSSSSTLGSGRLESFRAPRDLSLGSPSSNTKPKRKFEPIIQKHKPKSTNVTTTTSGPGVDQKKVKKEGHSKRERWERGKGGRGRGRGRGGGTIQTEGVVFGEGIAVLPVHRIRERFDLGKPSYKKADLGPKPFFKKEDLAPAEERDEEEIIRDLKNSSFIDDGIKFVGSAPMTLPFRKQVKMMKQERVKIEIKQEPQREPIVINGVTIKQEVKDERGDNDMEVDVKPSLASLPSPPVTLEDALKNTMFLMQLPDKLNGHIEVEVEAKPSTSQDPQASAPKASRRSETVPCTLSNLESGLVGYLEIRRSGRAQLMLGEKLVLNVELGTSAACREEVVSVEVDEESRTGSMKVLGQVMHRVICTPDYESELSKIKKHHKT